MACTTTARFGLRLAAHRPMIVSPISFFTPTSTVSAKRSLSSTAVILPSSARPQIVRSKLSVLAATPPPSGSSTPSSFFTPSLCRVRNASTSTSSISNSPLASPTGTYNPPTSSVTLDWNTFFKLRTSRRRYSLTTSIIASAATTMAAIITLSEYPEFGDQVTKLIPTDPIIGMGIATIGAVLLGWLIGPIFGNGAWRLLHRSRLPEFAIKERAFFERIKRHRVNPSGASANNPVPDFYGEKIGSVSGYRRWLKDQRAFNRKRGGIYA